MTATAQAKELGILCTSESVRAIFSGRKTQTRRVVRPQPALARPDGHYYVDRYNKSDEWAFWLPDGRMSEPRTWTCPYGTVGDRLWVRETWSALQSEYLYLKTGIGIVYRADPIESLPHLSWKSPIHMPRWASRLILEITAVRVERLQEITMLDARDEGIQIPCTTEGSPCLNISERVDSHPLWKDPKQATLEDYFTGYFALVWNRTNGKRWPWRSNPWVWVIGFKRCAQ